MDKHTGFLSLHTHPIVLELAKQKNVPIDEALEIFYNSRLYKLYEREETKLWHFSDLAIADMVIHELATGEVAVPVEG
jgi:hypothetical protein